MFHSLHEADAYADDNVGRGECLFDEDGGDAFDDGGEAGEDGEIPASAAMNRHRYYGCMLAPESPIITVRLHEDMLCGELLQEIGCREGNPLVQLGSQADACLRDLRGYSRAIASCVLLEILHIPPRELASLLEGQGIRVKFVGSFRDRWA
ncbi:MAG: hypothetical protein PHI23_04995 [Candidatus Peribacteraceae bacterium]|nr:hypothetical protein [Candidatus Peribacteraceae bacterium]